MCLPLVSCVFVAFLLPRCSWALLLSWRITFQNCIAETSPRCGPARQDFAINLDQNAILNGKNNCTTYANPDLGMEIQWNKLARQKADIGLHPHAIIWRRSTTKGSGQLRQRMWAGKWNEMAQDTEEIHLGEQKNMGVNTMKSAALNKKESAGGGLELVREQRESVGRKRKARRKTKESRWRRPGTSVRNKRKSVEDKANRGT